jgi:hypothetical protein
MTGPPKADRDLRVRPERLSSRLPDTAVVLLLGVVLLAVVVGAFTAAGPHYRTASVSDADRVAAATAERTAFKTIRVDVEFRSLDSVSRVDVVLPSGREETLDVNGEEFAGRADLLVHEPGALEFRYYDSDRTLVATDHVRVVQSGGI